MFPITRTAVQDFKDFCWRPRPMFIEQVDFTSLGETCFWATPTMPPITDTTVCIWRVYPKINGPEDGAYAD